MKHTINFSRDLALAAIKGVEDYYEAAESGLQVVTGNDLKQIQDKAKELHWEYDEIDISMQEHKMVFKMLIPNYFRYSCIVLLYLVLENKLKDMCIIVSNMSDDKSLPNFRRCLVNNCKIYLEDKIGFNSKIWSDLEDFDKIRNCIVHSSGKIDGNYELHLLNLANRGIGITISGTNNEMLINQQPLYLENNMIIIEPEYCRNIIKTVYKFFEELCYHLWPTI